MKICRKKAAAVTVSFNTLSEQIKELESRMTANGELQKQIVSYAKTRAVYVEYRKAGYSKKFRSEHEADILLHQAAKKYFDSMGILRNLPSVKSLREEYAGLLEQKRKAYAAYKQARSDIKGASQYQGQCGLSAGRSFFPGAAERQAKIPAISLMLLWVFSVPKERAAVTAGDDLRGLGTCHQQAIFAGLPGTANLRK